MIFFFYFSSGHLLVFIVFSSLFLKSFWGDDFDDEENEIVLLWIKLFSAHLTCAWRFWLVSLNKRDFRLCFHFLDPATEWHLLTIEKWNWWTGWVKSNFWSSNDRRFVFNWPCLFLYYFLTLLGFGEWSFNQFNIGIFPFWSNSTLQKFSKKIFLVKLLVWRK